MKLASIHLDIEFDNFNYLKHFPNSPRAEIFGHSLDENMTVEALVNWYYDLKKSTWRESTQEDYRDHIDNHIIPGIGGILAKKLKPAHVMKWLSKNPSTNKRKNDFLAILRQTYLAAVKNEKLANNALRDFENLPTTRTEPTPLNPDEVDMVLASFESEIAEHFYQLRLWSGLSPSEALGLQWPDIEFENDRILIRRAIVGGREEETKNNKRWRTVNLLPPARDALIKLFETRAENTWVFTDPSTGTYFKAEFMRDHWNKALKKAGIKHQRSYTARHTYASIMLSIGLPLSWLKEQMGHTNYRMLEDVYGRWLNISAAKRKEILQWFLKWSQDGHIPEAIAPFIRGIQ